MNQKVPFYKLAASGNDFIVVDNRKRIVLNPKKFARDYCRIHTGVGADGVLLLEKSRAGAFRMRIINSDGSEAEACGNGFRCIARYAHEILGFSPVIRFESAAGMVDAKVSGSRVRVRLPKPRDILENGQLSAGGQKYRFAFINTGVPHVVIFTKHLKEIDLESIAPKIRHHRRFTPRGTNVNFVEVRSKHEIHVRTYERGVEAETMACGTGSTASAVLSAIKKLTRPPIRVRTSGGETLIIDFRNHELDVENVTLEGEVGILFKGELLNV